MHLGHVEVIKGLLNDAAHLGLPSTVMLFEPQPQEFFAKDKAPARLTRLRDKLRLLARLGVDRVICVSFNHRFANIDAEHFIEEVLHQKLGVKALTIGDDFRFGHNRRGDFDMLVQFGHKCGMSVKSTASFRQLDLRVSSTLIRTALCDGDITTANAMLGHAYAISGRVIHGWKKGRELGFRTANVALKRNVSPVQGVFAVQVYWQDRLLQGVANVGTKPTLNGTQALLEVHLLDFNETIYGQFIHVELLTKLRDEQKFANLAQLVTQIEYDVTAAKRWFAVN
ncbi:Riboflavin kinase [Pseudoalteromonas luteoviolacea B = ATCC 29581]|nr:Riboflavin kinase [Pseudoalteromonas luteoviolacea B = ATCC 29581]